MRRLLLFASLIALTGATAEIDPDYPLAYSGGLQPETRYVRQKDVIVTNRVPSPLRATQQLTSGWRLRPLVQAPQATHPRNRLWFTSPRYAYYYTYPTYPSGYYGFPYQYYPVAFPLPVK